MTRDEIKTNPLYLSEEFRLSNKQTSHNKKKKWFITIKCDKCNDKVTKTYQKNSWHFTCGKCTRGRKSPEQFIKECKQIHGDKYDYSETEYINNSINVAIICPKHGVFYPRPVDFLTGTKCPICAVEMRSQVIPDRLANVPATLYLVKFGPSLYKLGVTVQSIHSRLLSCTQKYTIEKKLEGTYAEVCAIEHRLKITNNNKQITMKEGFINGGKHEFFTEPLYIKEIDDINTITQTVCVVSNHISTDMDSYTS